MKTRTRKDRVITRHTSKDGAGKSVKLYSARQVHDANIIYWIKSYKAVLAYMNRYADILKPIKFGSHSGLRYFIPEQNLKEFVRMFEQNELS